LRFRIIDIETTGLTPPAEIIEVGRVDVLVEEDSVIIGAPRSRLFRPVNGIPPETMAIHHITEADFDGATINCSAAAIFSEIFEDSIPDAFVAHNCEFEQRFIPNHITGTVPWICTHKLALRVWPDAPRHSNQVLRYWRGLTLDPAFAMPPHRAAPDAWVTAHLFSELVKAASFDELVDWTLKPKMMPTIAFGKHRGAKWSDIPSDYLSWMTRQADMDRDAVFCAREELARRSADAAADTAVVEAASF